MLAALLLLPTLVVAPGDLVIERDFERRGGALHFDARCTATAIARLPLSVPAGVWRIDVEWAGEAPVVGVEAAGRQVDSVRPLQGTGVLRAPVPVSLVITIAGGLRVDDSWIGRVTLRRIDALPGELAPAEPPGWVRHLAPETLLTVRPPLNPIPEVIALARYVAGTRWRTGWRDAGAVARLARLDDAAGYDYPARLADAWARALSR